jgi:hypothetical protein
MRPPSAPLFHHKGTATERALFNTETRRHSCREVIEGYRDMGAIFLEIEKQAPLPRV